MNSLTRQLADWACALEYEQLPAEVVCRLRSCVLYQLGIGLAGHTLESPYQVHRLMLAEGAAGQASLLLGGRSSAMNAAYANATLFHARVQDDTHHTSHLGTALIAAGLALAEARGANGRQLMTALAAGYEVAAALGREYTSATTPRGFRASGLFAGLGAAVVAARLLQLDEAATSHALGIAATLASGTIQPFASGTEEFLLHNAQAARNGILAGLMAEQGMLAAEAALDGPAGFLQAFAGKLVDNEAVTGRLGEHFELLQVTFKAVPVCAGNQAPLFNAMTLGGLLSQSDVGDIERIRIEMNPYEAHHPGIANRGPFRSRIQTLMSTPFCVALGLLGREPTMAALHDFDDADILRLVQRSEVVANADLPMLHSSICLQLSDGRGLSNRFRLAEADLHWSWQHTRSQVTGLLEQMPISAAWLQQRIDSIAQLEHHQDWAWLLDIRR